MSTKSLLCRAAALALLLSSGGSAMAAVFATPGWAGTIDDNDKNYFYTSSNGVGVLSTAPDPTTVNVFYNVPQLSGFSGNTGMRWTVRYREDVGARVLLTLRRLDVESGTSTVVDTFDSDLFADTPGVSRTDQRCVAVSWDFNLAAYAVEAAVTRVDDTHTAFLYGFSIEPLFGGCP